MNPIQRLRDTELVVISGNGIYRIFKPAHENEAGDDYNFVGWSSDSPEINTTIKLTDRRGLLYFENGLWIFRVWDHVPGPGPDDFAYGYEDLDRAVDAVLDYYQGEPTRIGVWWVPLHRHPYLDIDAVRHCVNEAKRLTVTAFHDLTQDRAAKFAAEDKSNSSGDEVTLARPQAVMRLQFIECPSLTHARRMLHLRRDAEEAYIVTPDDDTSA